MEDVSAVLQSHVEWDAGLRACAVEMLQYLPQLVHLDRMPYLPTQKRTSMISSWRIGLSLVFCPMLRDVRGFLGRKDLKSLSLSQDTRSTGIGSLLAMVCCTGFQGTRKPRQIVSSMLFLTCSRLKFCMEFTTEPYIKLSTGASA